MGQAVERQAVARGHEIVARYDENNPLPASSAPAPKEVQEADVLIDFTLPSVVLENIDRYTTWQKPAVIGTTGWSKHLKAVEEMVAGSGTGLLYAPNFSIGVAILVRALRGVLPLLEAFPEYDPFIHEVHHVRKVDSPSGTALLLGNVLVDGLTRKDHIETETQHERIDPAALHVTSARGGNVVGRHIVTLDSPFDWIELSHEARSREGFAFGAVRAAEWLKGRKGLFTLDDMLAEAGL